MSSRHRPEPLDGRVEVAYFVPPAVQNGVKPSQRGVLSNTTQVWGVVVDETTGLIYASDMNSGRLQTPPNLTRGV